MAAKGSNLTKFFHVTCRKADMRLLVQLLGAKSPKFVAIADNFRLRSQIYPKGMKHRQGKNGVINYNLSHVRPKNINFGPLTRSLVVSCLPTKTQQRDFGQLCTFSRISLERIKQSTSGKRVINYHLYHVDEKKWVNFGPLTTKFSCLMLTHKNELLACSQANAFSTAHLPLLRDEFQTPKSSLYCSLTYGAGRHHPKL